MIRTAIAKCVAGVVFCLAYLNVSYAFPLNPVPPVPPIAVSTKNIALVFQEETENRPVINFKGSVFHGVSFLPDLSLHGKTLLKTPAAGWISWNQGASDSWLSPVAGSYHGGGVGYSDYTLNPIAVTPLEGLNRFRWDITGQMRLGADAPRPSVFHGEYTSGFSNATSIGLAGALAISPMGVRITIDDGIIGSVESPEATEIDSLAVTVAGQEFASVTDVIARFGYANIDSASGLTIAASKEGQVTVSLKYGVGEPYFWSGDVVEYTVSLVDGIFDATDNWGDLWEPVKDSSGRVLSAFLPTTYWPSYQWWSTTGGDWSYLRTIQFSEQDVVQAPTSLLLVLVGLVSLSRLRREQLSRAHDFDPLDKAR